MALCGYGYYQRCDYPAAPPPQASPEPLPAPFPKCVELGTVDRTSSFAQGLGASVGLAAHAGSCRVREVLQLPNPRVAGISVLNEPAVDKEVRTNSGRTALSVAVRAGHVDAVKTLLDSGRFDVNARDGDSFTALLVAAYAGQVEVLRYLLDRRDVLKQVLDYTDRNAVFLAVVAGSKEAVDLLLKRGVKANVCSTGELTPLAYAEKMRDLNDSDPRWRDIVNLLKPYAKPTDCKLLP